MIRLFIKAGLLLFIFLPFGCMPTAKIKSYPDYLGYYTGETILLPNSFQGVSQNYSNHLNSWTSKKYGKRLPSLSQLSFEDTDYMARQWGISLTDIDVKNPKRLKFIYEKIGINYMIINHLKMSEHTSLNFDDATTKSATLRLQLIDFRNGLVIWKSEATVNIGSLIIMDDDQVYPFNFSTKVGAFDKAYRKSIKRLIKNSHLIQVK